MSVVAAFRARAGAFPGAGALRPRLAPAPAAAPRAPWLVWLVLAGCAGAAVGTATGSLSPVRAAAATVALPLLGVVVLLAFSRPALLFVAAFFLLAIVRIQPAPVDLVFVVLMIATIATRRWRPHLPPSIAIVLPLFATIGVVSMTNAQSLKHAVQFEATTLYLIATAVWLTAMFVDGAVTRRAVVAYVYGAALSALFGVVALHVHFPGSSVLLYDPHRAEALFKDPNVFGPFLVPAAIIVLEDIANPRLLDWSTRRKVAVFAILTAGVIFAFSRAAWLNYAIAIVTLVTVYAWRRRGAAAALRAVTAIAVCAAIGFGALAATGSIGFLLSRSHEQTYDHQRFATQATGLEHTTAHVFGYGPGEADTRLEISTHNVFARVAYEQGLLGVTLLLVLLVSTAFAALGLVVRNETVHGVGSAALLASWLGVVPNSFFIDTLHWRHLWVLAALIWFGSTQRRAREPRAAARETVAPA